MTEQDEHLALVVLRDGSEVMLVFDSPEHRDRVLAGNNVRLVHRIERELSRLPGGDPPTTSR